MSYNEFIATYNRWVSETDFPWTENLRIPKSWALENINNRFCDWWIYAHVNGFWFLGGEGGGQFDYEWV